MRCRVKKVSFGCVGEVLGTHERHLEVAKLVPEVFGGVDADQSGDEQADPLDAVER